LNSLPPEYANLVTSVETQQELPTIQFIIDRIKNETIKHLPQIRNESIFNASNENNYNSKKCTYCKRHGHIDKECRTKLRETKQRIESAATVTDREENIFLTQGKPL
jgi:hypothetical protein